MKCICCKKELDKSFFLPHREDITRYEKCVSCLYNYYNSITTFLKEAMQEDIPDTYIQKVEPVLFEVAKDITCYEYDESSLTSFAKSMKLLHAKPNQLKRTKDTLKIELQCATSCDCHFSGFYFSDQERHVVKIQQRHTCNSKTRNLDKKFHEVSRFIAFVSRLETCIQDQQKEQIEKLSVDYFDISGVYKVLQEELHNLEDTTIKNIWGMPCRWRRARGEKNIAPEKEDKEKLLKLAEEKNLPQKVLDYIHSNFQTPIESTYFQQRGYFLLLCMAKPEDLKKIIEKRIQIMLYARNLLKNNFFLLCNKRLNCTVLRNHVWIILLLMLALKSSNNLELFPLMGVTNPRDSELDNFYEIIETINVIF